MKNYNSAYQKAFVKYLRRGVTPEISLKSDDNIGMYIWLTMGDEKVRNSHAANEGGLFIWTEPPETGHPGEEFGCRCFADEYVKGVSEYAHQGLIGNFTENANSWGTYDFVNHYYNGKEDFVTLENIGLKEKILNYYAYDIGKFNTINNQIIDIARNSGPGNFSHGFIGSYNFIGEAFSLGRSTIGGIFLGVMKMQNGMMYINGKIQYFYKDEFTDPLDIREISSGSSSSSSVAKDGAVTEFGGQYYGIVDSWTTSFIAEARYDRNSSAYRYDLDIEELSKMSE